jgi:hypothetical protein
MSRSKTLTPIIKQPSLRKHDFTCLSKWPVPLVDLPDNSFLQNLYQAPYLTGLPPMSLLSASRYCHTSEVNNLCLLAAPQAPTSTLAVLSVGLPSLGGGGALVEVGCVLGPPLPLPLASASLSGNEATMTKIVVDGSSRTGHVHEATRCDGPRPAGCGS